MRLNILLLRSQFFECFALNLSEKCLGPPKIGSFRERKRGGGGINFFLQQRLAMVALFEGL